MFVLFLHSHLLFPCLQANVQLWYHFLSFLQNLPFFKIFGLLATFVLLNSVNLTFFFKDFLFLYQLEKKKGNRNWVRMLGEGLGWSPYFPLYVEIFKEPQYGCVLSSMTGSDHDIHNPHPEIITCPFLLLHCKEPLC